MRHAPNCSEIGTFPSRACFDASQLPSRSSVCKCVLLIETLASHFARVILGNYYEGEVEMAKGIHINAGLILTRFCGPAAEVKVPPSAVGGT